jgi:hypothetical protein
MSAALGRGLAGVVRLPVSVYVPLPLLLLLTVTV